MTSLIIGLFSLVGMLGVIVVPFVGRSDDAMVDRRHFDSAPFSIPSNTNWGRGHKRRRGHHLLLWIRLIPPNTICVTIYNDDQVQHHLCCVILLH
jgi:hypothetical protein